MHTSQQRDEVKDVDPPLSWTIEIKLKSTFEYETSFDFVMKFLAQVKSTVLLHEQNLLSPNLFNLFFVCGCDGAFTQRNLKSFVSAGYFKAVWSSN